MNQQCQLTDRVEKVAAVTECGKNVALWRYGIDQVRQLLNRLDYEDLNDTEMGVVAANLGAAYKRKDPAAVADRSLRQSPSFIVPRLRVEYLLARLDYEDLNRIELSAVYLTLAEAYGRKLLGTPMTLRLISEFTHRSSAG